MVSRSTAGNAGPKVRSDCEILLELGKSGGIKIEIKSKVKALYGRSIENQCREILQFFRIRNAAVTIDDSGALPFVLAARLEAAIRIGTGSEQEYLPGMLPGNNYSTGNDRFRFTRLYLPGNTPSLMINAGLHSADGIILDLEDSVAPLKKFEARILVRNALRQIDFNGAERMVRINQGENGLDDLDSVIPHNVNMILLPKCESAEAVLIVDSKISEIRKKMNNAGPVWIMPIIESALGIENCFAIASSCKNVAAIAIGLEDYTSDMGVQRTTGGKESMYARMRLVNAAKAAGIQAIDSVFSDVDDMAALESGVADSKALGFEGMGCIHPRQVAVIKKGFTPGYDEIEKAKKIFLAYEEAKSKGLGVISLGSKMIDPPVVARAVKTIGLAIKLGLLKEDWSLEMPS
jgi:citrate lyase subunit beta / citryl-CoA lyase